MPLSTLKLYASISIALAVLFFTAMVLRLPSARAESPYHDDDPVDDFCRLYCDCGDRCGYGRHGPGHGGWDLDDEYLACDSVWCQWYCGTRPAY